MKAEVQVIEGGKLIRKEMMKLTPVREFSDETAIFENEEGRAVIYFKKKDEYILVSIDMA